MSDHFLTDVGSTEPQERLSLDLVGPLRLGDGCGADLTPTGAKAQGLLALLGTSPALRRSRSWLQDKLWSDRPAEQGAASLRQCLRRVRAALGPHAGCLIADRTWVALDPAGVLVRRTCGPDAADAEFLEGLDVPDREFEHWLRDQRLGHAERAAGGRGLAAGAAAGGGAGGAPALPSGLTAIGLVSRSATGGDSGCDGGCEGGGQMFADEMLELVGAALLDRGTVDLVDLRTPAEWHTLGSGQGPRWLLCAAASIWRGRVRIALSLTEVRVDRLRWTEARTFDAEAFYGRDALAVRSFVRDATQRVAAQTAPSGGAARDPGAGRDGSLVPSAGWLASPGERGGLAI